jgi:hypothetical protein
MTCLGLVEPKNISWLMQANNDLHFQKFVYQANILFKPRILTFDSHRL